MPKCHLGLRASGNPLSRNEARAVRFDHRSGRPLRLTARARDHHNDHHGDDAAARLQDSRHGHHAAPLHVRSLDRARASSGLEACIARDLWRRPRWRAHPRDPHACDADGHHEGNPHGRHGELPCARNLDHACAYGSRGVSRYMQPLAMLLLPCWFPLDSLSTMEIIARTSTCTQINLKYVML